MPRFLFQAASFSPLQASMLLSRRGSSTTADTIIIALRLNNIALQFKVAILRAPRPEAHHGLFRSVLAG